MSSAKSTAPVSPARLTVSQIRQRIYEVSRGELSLGEHSDEQPPGLSPGPGRVAGQLFHLVAECAFRHQHPASWESVLTAELNTGEWLAALYEHVLAPELVRLQPSLRDSGREVLMLWRGVQSFARWFCGILKQAIESGSVRYDGQREQWLGVESFFRAECEVAATLSDPGWTQPVIVIGRLDHIVRVAPDRWCVVEFKLGPGHPEADAAQACLYHELLAREQPDREQSGGGSAAIVRFGRFGVETEADETVVARELIEQARPELMALVGALAGVLNSNQANVSARSTVFNPLRSDSTSSGGNVRSINAVAVDAPSSGAVSINKESPDTAWPKQANDAEIEIGRKLVRALQEFGSEARLAADPLVGPAFVRYLLEPGRGVTAARIERQGPNLQMRLMLDHEPIIGRIEGRIAVDVQRPQREYVAFGDLIASLLTRRSENGNASALGGVDLKGRIHFIDLARDTPHLLVGGMSGSGKSEWLRSAVASLLVSNDPSTLRVVLVDPKKNAFPELAASPFLWRPDALIDSPDGAVLVLLQDLIEEISRRNTLFKQEAADDLAHYQRKTGTAPPRILCVVDEFADLLMSGGKKQRDEFEQGFVRIAQMGRAAGVHLVLATQRPSRQVVSGVLKANLTGKVALRVANRIDSSVLLDQGGAQHLLGKGDLLLSAGSGDPVRLQSAWLSEQERQHIFSQRG